MFAFSINASEYKHDETRFQNILKNADIYVSQHKSGDLKTSHPLEKKRGLLHCFCT